MKKNLLFFAADFAAAAEFMICSTRSSETISCAFAECKRFIKTSIDLSNVSTWKNFFLSKMNILKRKLLTVAIFARLLISRSRWSVENNKNQSEDPQKIHSHSMFSDVCSFSMQFDAFRCNPIFFDVFRCFSIFFDVFWCPM